MRRILLVILIMALFLPSAMGEIVVFGDRMKVAYCNEYITLRTEPDSKSDAITRIPLNSEVIWLYQDFDGFSYVMYKGTPGYVASKYLKLLPEETAPDKVVLLDEETPRPVNYDIGCLYTVDVSDFHLILDESDGGRMVLLPGDEVTMIEKGDAFSRIEFDEHKLNVPNEILKLKNDFARSPVSLNRTEQYRLNAFFSNLSQSGFAFHYGEALKSDEFIYEDERLIQFVLSYLQLNFPELLRPADDDAWAGYYAVIEGGCIQALIDRYFSENYGYESENWYDSLYYENIKEYHFVYTGESWEFLKDYNSQVDAAYLIDDDRYAIRFHTENEDGFAILYAPDGLESSKDWNLEYYLTQYTEM